MSAKPHDDGCSAVLKSGDNYYDEIKIDNDWYYNKHRHQVQSHKYTHGH